MEGLTIALIVGGFVTLIFIIWFLALGTDWFDWKKMQTNRGPISMYYSSNDTI